MTKKIFSCSYSGLLCQIIEVEADISQGLPHFTIVGLGDASVQESKERVRSSIKNSGATFPNNRKTINLAPAEVKKQGSLFDLPIALSILLATNQINDEKFKDSIIVGELSLNGRIKSIRGALLLTQHAKEQGFKKIFLPMDNAMEASFIEDVEIYPLENLKQLIDYAQSLIDITPQKIANFERTARRLKKDQYFALKNILGLEGSKRALSIAAAGGHNVLMTGPPGTGKTILARAFSEIVPDMSKEEILETTKIFSIAGLTENINPLIVKRPFREVHHTASLVSIVGGGAVSPQPGEISLAHNGVLFFDEITEFPSKALEALRQPLEDKYINICRAHFSCKFPSNFIFIATMNPCPCGYKGDTKITCICSDKQIKDYQKKLSGPILDRFDIFLEISGITLKGIFENNENRQKEEISIIKSIHNASKIQQKRFQKSTISKNGDMTMEEIKKHCHLGQSALKAMNFAADNLKLSNRGYLRTLKVARTIADICDCENIAIEHINEAVYYRKR